MAAVAYDASEILTRAARGPHLMLIDGKWSEAEAGASLDVFDPVTGQVIAKVPSGQQADIDRAVKAAALTRLESLNNEMPAELAGYTVGVSSEAFRYYAGWCTKIGGQTQDLSAGASNVLAYTRREPIGVAGMITP